MKKNFFFFGVILMALSLSTHAQIQEMLYQGFEPGETVRYTTAVATDAVPSEVIYMGGTRSLQLRQNSSSDVELFLDTLDFTQDISLTYIALQFDHICHVPINSSGNIGMGTIYYKLADQSDDQWSQLGRNEYDRSGEYSTEFYGTDVFSAESYPEWENTSQATTNSMWKSERFNLDNVLTSSLAQNRRKLIIKFKLKKKSTNTAIDTNKIGWWLDNIKVRASSARMITPNISMVHYPHAGAYPNSRGARIELDATTVSQVPEGIHPDSVFLYYKVGSDTTVYRKNMHVKPGYTNRYTAQVPFVGYDTLVNFYCVAHDATTNANRVSFPASDNAWVTFWYVRGTGQPGIQTDGFTGSQTEEWFPFPARADHRSEFVYDSALMNAAGYGPGAITSLRFTFGANTTAQNRPRFQIKMRNVGTDHTVNSSLAKIPYTTDFMHVVYDAELNIPVRSAGDTMTIQFQDTFYYAGKDMIMTVTCDGSSDPAATKVKAISALSTKKSFYTYIDAGMNKNPFTDALFRTGNQKTSTRPAFVFYQHANMPLLHDVGFDTVSTSSDYGLVTPNYDVPMTLGDHSIQVKLKNYGALAVDSIRISYSINDTLVTGYFDWTNSVAGGSVQLVTIRQNVALPAGFYKLKVWVEDTLKSNGQRYRDHEPYNDTISSEFIVCDGAMHGVRNIGGSNPHFGSIEEFLFSLNRCGMDDTLIVRLAPGNYPPFTLSQVAGLSREHYLVFESMDSEHAVLFSDNTCTQGSIVNLSSVANVRFRNLDFVRRNGALPEMVTMASSSNNCRFEGCRFIDSLTSASGSLLINKMISSGYADSTLVDNCTFVGGKIGVEISGQAADIRSKGNIVRRSLFYNQYDNALRVENQDDARIEDNEMYDVGNNSSYVLQMIYCYGNSAMLRNKVYTSHGAGGIGVSNLVGTAATPIVVANNMVVSEDDGTATLLRSPFNIVLGDYIECVYNSVKMYAPQRNNIAAATFGGGAQPLNYSRFMNNIVVTLDETNYAFSYQAANNGTNTVSNNVYYSNGHTLNRRGSLSYATLAAWQVVEVGDSTSISVNPNFIDGSLIDLRTYSRYVQGKAAPVPSVTTDIFGTARDTEHPCPGAFEFLPLTYDFKPEALVSPLAEDCYMPEQVELQLVIRNEGISAFDPNAGQTLGFHYQILGNAVQSGTINQVIPAVGTATVQTGAMLQLPPNGIFDSIYTIRFWLDFAADPNKTNDTNIFTVVSRAHPEAPGNDTVWVSYNSDTVVTPTRGVNTWAVYNDATAPERPSQIYWFKNASDIAPFHIGHSYTTSVLREDTLFYIMQRREMPIVRFTQIEIAHASTSAGVTTPKPYWMGDSRKVAVQLTNIGDATAYLEGDTLQTVSKTSALNTVFVMPNVKIEPGQSLVVQYDKVTNNPATDSSRTIRTQTASNTGLTPAITYNSNIGFIYRRGGVIEDAVAFNTVITDGTSWTSKNVPSYVWNGSAIAFANNKAGVIRTAFDGGASDWTISSATNPMFMDNTDASWIRYTDNGCMGEMATVKVAMLAPPTEDLAVSNLVLPEDGCGLGLENITLSVHNYGTADVDTFEICYYAGGVDTVREVIQEGIRSHGDTTVTFSTPLNLALPTDSTVNVKAWVSPLAGDPVRSNDTVMGSVTSLYTPAMPAPVADRMVPYAASDTITEIPTGNYIPIWYDYSLNPVDTGYTHVTDYLYNNGVMGVSHLALKMSNVQVGHGTATNGNNALPSPYQPSAKFIKQQYLYTAYDLQQAGMVPGKVKSISFFLDTIKVNADSINLYDYTISVGQTSDTIFASGTSWKAMSTVVWQRDTLTLFRANSHLWITHQLDSTFVWDGESSVAVQVTYTLPAVLSASNKDVKTLCESKTKTVLHKGQASAISATTSGTVAANRPNILFNEEIFGCTGPMRTYNVNLTGVPPVDAAMFPLGDSLVYNSCDSIALPVKIRNQGSNVIDTVKFHYFLDGQEVDSTQHIISLAQGQTIVLDLFKKEILPGRHTVTAVACLTGDSVQSNDTVSGSFIVRLCGGDYTIAADSTGDYVTFGEIVDTMNVVGIVGSVTLHVAPGIYNEQVHINNVYGSSPSAGIHIVGNGEGAVLTGTTGEQANYLMKVEGVSNFSLNNMTLISVPTKGTSTNDAKKTYYGHVLVLEDVNGASVTGSTLRVSLNPAANDKAENCLFSNIALFGNVSRLDVKNCWLDSGAYAVKSYGTEYNYDGIAIENDSISNFACGAIGIRGASNLYVRYNDMRSSNASDSRGLTGMYIAQTTDSLVIESNKVYLLSNNKGAKRGIQLEHVVAPNYAPVFVVNNMIGLKSTASQSLPEVTIAGTTKKIISAGIIVDSSSMNVNVFFNSIMVNGTTATNNVNDLTMAFFCGATPSNVQVMANIFSNFSRGYAYYVGSTTSITASNENAYYSEAANPFMWGTTNCATLSILKTNNSKDVNSVFDKPFYVADDDLHLLVTNFFGLASHNPDVPTDIDGKFRETMAGTTIGAQELSRFTHDMSVVEIIEPVVPANPQDIETDDVRVIATFYNNGRSNEPVVRWYAYIEGYENETRSVTRLLNNVAPSQMLTDTVMIPTVLGLIDTQNVRVVLELDNDADSSNNELSTAVYLAPAYNLLADKMEVINPITPKGCLMQNCQIKITLKNVGKKPFQANTPIKIGYHTQIKTPANVTISTLPDTVEQMVVLPSLLPVNSSVDFIFDSIANLYPTDTAVLMKVQVKGWCNYQHDIKPANDTTAFIERDSYFTPAAPVGIDDTLPYGTWGELHADQENQLKIRWYRDTNSSSFWTGSNYNASRTWNMGNSQFFHDSTFYLNCLNTKNCTSAFSQVTVHVADRIENDMAFDSILAPLGGRVYMENDTVRIRVVNYGTRPQSNIPVAYQLKQGNNVIQTVSETIAATIPAGQTYIYTFDSLLTISSPTTSKTYSLLVWTDLANDGTRRADTIRVARTFSSLPQSRYTSTYNFKPTTDDVKYDITRCSWNGIDIDMPPLGRAITDMADYNSISHPDYPVVHVTRGTTDSLLLEITPMEEGGQRFRVRATVEIDFDRNGKMEAWPDDRNEILVDGVPFYNDSVFRAVVSIPQCASLGYMRMRVYVKGYDADAKDGHLLDFLLFVDEQAPVADISLAQIVSPRSYLIRDDSPRAVSFRMLNRGRTTVNSVDIQYSFNAEEGNSVTGTLPWTGTLLPGTSTIVTLPEHSFSVGTTSLSISHSMQGDVVPENNLLVHEYHRFHVVVPIIMDSFENADYWYAPTGYNDFSRNYWQRGAPHKTNIDTAYSGRNAWVTDLNSNIAPGKKGNVSYLYSPIINTSIHPDTISFRLRRDFKKGSSMHVEFYNYEGKWVKFDYDSAEFWYTDQDNRVFNGTSSASEGYRLYYIATTSSGVSGDFPERLQFRFVYRTPMTNDNFGGGCAVDDFRIGRARRNIDAGVVDITYPTTPKYGQTYYPEVVVKNYGLDTLSSIQIGYIHYGTYLAKISNVGNLAIPPDGTDTLRFNVPFTITSDYPDSFYITAFTNFGSLDKYDDNDTCTKLFQLTPLDNDISADRFLAPLDNVIAGDTTVNVTMRIRNIGLNPITTATATYRVNGGEPVVEQIDFTALLGGQPLQPREYYNYTFNRKIHASMGIMSIVAYVQSPENEYVYNDTITKRFQGITSVTDLAAASVIVDTSALNFVRIGLVIENRGARGANNFEVGYWIDNDTGTMVRETYYRANPIPALTTGYYLFADSLPARSAPYSFVSAYVKIAGDNDPSNDTTDAQVRQYTDIEVVKVIVEENAANECRVFLELRNIGNLSLVDKRLRLRASINGNDLSYDVRQRVDPHQTVTVLFDHTIPKSLNRSYVGTGRVLDIPGDTNSANNQTNIIEVVNLVEGIPSVDASRLVLDQNYPNPFTGTTSVAFHLPAAAQVHFFIIDATGRLMHSESQFRSAGRHTLTLDLASYPAGIYFYGIQVDGRRLMRKMILK